MQGTRNLPTPRRWVHPYRTMGLLALLAFHSLGCATIGQRGVSLVPTRYQVRTGPFLLYSDKPIPADSAAIRCLHSLEMDLEDRLGYRSKPDEEPVEIYVLNDRDSYSHFLKFYYPELPQRRAFFLAQADRRVVYTYFSERLDEDLRHEATHALIRGAYGDLPLWLDEGLAEYFESGRRGIEGKDDHLAKISKDLESGWVPDLARLESLKGIREMSPRDYRESWAWVHLLLESETPNRSPLIDYFRHGEHGASRKSLSAILASSGISAKSLTTHLEAEQSRIASSASEPRPLSMTATAPSERVFSRISHRGDRPARVAEPPVVRAQTPARPGFFRRLASMLGF